MTAEGWICWACEGKLIIKEMLKTEVNELWALNQEMWLLHMYRDHLDQTTEKLDQDETRLEFELKEIWEWDMGNERIVRDRIADL